MRERNLDLAALHRDSRRCARLIAHMARHLRLRRFSGPGVGDVEEYLPETLPLQPEVRAGVQMNDLHALLKKFDERQEEIAVASALVEAVRFDVGSGDDHYAIGEEVENKRARIDASAMSETENSSKHNNLVSRLSSSATRETGSVWPAPSRRAR